MGNVQGRAISSANKAKANVLINEAVAKYPIVIFSKTYCPYCHSANAHIAASRRMLTDMPALKVYKLNHMGKLGTAVQVSLAERTGRNTVPNVFVDGQSVGGGDEIAAFARSGVLKQMMANARDHYASRPPL